MTLTTKRWIARARRSVTSMGRARLAVCAAMAALLVGGGVWLAMAGNAPRYVRLTDSAVAPADLPGVQAALAARQIPFQLQGGAVMVPSDRLAAARSAVDAAGAGAAKDASPLEKTLREESIFTSESQNSRHWLLAKMNLLARQIETLPAVRTASVIIEPGQSRRLGSPAVPPSAAVTVGLADNSRLNNKVVAAIADMVAGATPGMTRSNVRVIDSSGQSWRVDEGAAVTGDEHIDRLRVSEAYFAGKARAALTYIEDVIVTVRVSPKGEEFACESLSVMLPRSYLRSVARSLHGASPSAEEMDAAGQEQLRKVRQTLAAVVADPAAINVDWYMDQLADLPPATAPAVASATPTSGVEARRAAEGLSHWAILSMTAGAAALLGAAAGGWLWWRRRGRDDADDAVTSLADDQRLEHADPLSQGAFGFLQQALSDELITFIQGEHPQTVALVLSHLKPSKAAAVLASLPQAKQVEVARRVASLDRIDPEVVREVERGLAERLSKAAQEHHDRLGGPQALARMLHHAGMATERNVLRSLAQQEPALAQTLRRQMMGFDDLVRVPPLRLREALAAVKPQELAIALRTAGAEVRNKVMTTLPSASVKVLREEMTRLGPVRLSDVEAAQERVVEMLGLTEEGQYLSVSGEGQGDYTA